MKTRTPILLAALLAASGAAQAADNASAPAATSNEKPAAGAHPRHSHAVEKGLIPPQAAHPGKKRKPMKPKEERHVHGAERH